MKISCTKNAAFHCWFTLPAPGAACHRLRVPKSELESLILKSIKRQSKTIMASFSLSGGIRAPQIPAASEHEALMEKLQDEKQRLYESLVLGGICREEYKTKTSSIDIEIKKVKQILDVILDQRSRRVTDEVAVEAAEQALRKRILTKELVEMLIEKVLVFPDSRIEIEWKLAGFINCLAQKTGFEATI